MLLSVRLFRPAPSAIIESHAKRPCRTKKPLISDWSDDEMDFEPVKSKEVHTPSTSDEDSFTYAQPDSQYMGKKIRMKFNVGDSNPEYEWYSGQILNFDPMTGKYGAFFPSDQQTVYIDPVEEAEDIEIIN